MKILEEKEVYRGKFMDFVVFKYERGGRIYERQIVRHPGAVVIVAVNGEGKVIYERQFRFTTGGYIVELPAGTLEPNEYPLETARRELVEETGYEARRWEKVAEFYLAPGYSTEYMHLFIARELVFIGRNPDEDEDIEVMLLDVEQIRNFLKEGKFKDAKTILGTLMYLYSFNLRI